MNRILEVEAERWRSYRHLRYDVPTRGLTLIDGIDAKSKGSNGSGKTSTLDLPYWLLYGELPRGGLADSVIQKGEESCDGTGKYQIGQDQWEIYRARGPANLEVKINGKPVEKKSKELQEMINKALPKDLYGAACYIASRAKSFFDMSDADRMNLFCILANAREMDAGHAKAKAERDAAKTKLLVAQSARDTLGAVILESQGRIESMQQKIAESREEPALLLAQLSEAEEILHDVSLELGQELVTQKQERSAEYDELRVALQGQINIMRGQIEQLTGQIGQKQAQLPANLTQAIADAKAAHAHATQQNLARQQAELHNQKIKGKIEHEAAHAESVGNKGTCDRCGQTLPEKDMADALNRSIDAIQALESQLKEVPEAIDTVPLQQAVTLAQQAYTNAKVQAEQEPDRLRVERAKIENESKAAQGQLRVAELEFKESMGALQTVYDQEIEPLARKVEQCKQAHREAAARLVGLERELAGAKESRQASVQKYEGLGKQIESLENEILEANEAMVLFRDYRAVQIEDCVFRVSQLASDYLQQLTQGQFTTRLDQTKEKDDGQTKIVLRPVILQGGIESTLYDSDGQLGRAKFAYDLALNQVAANGLPLMIDEGLRGLDEPGKLEALELLKRIAQDRAVFIIDHTDSLKTSIDKVWQVTRGQDEISVLDCQ